MFGIELMDALYYIVVFDVLLVLGMGIAAAALHLAGSNFDWYVDRLLPAVASLVGTSLAAGAMMWVANAVAY